MALHLSTRDVARLDRANAVLLTPFAYSSSSEWRREACRALESLVNASNSAFTMDVDGEELVAGEPDIVDALRALVPPPDWLIDGLVVRRRQLRTSVTDWSEIYDIDAIRRTSFYLDVAIPYRMLAPLSIVVDVPGRAIPTVVSLHDESESAARERLPRRRTLLQLVSPAFRSGVFAYAALAQRRTRLTTTLDNALMSIALCDARAERVHENPALTQLLYSDPERDRIRTEVKRVARAVASLVHVRHNKIADDVTLMRSTAEPRTAIARYRLTATLWSEGESERSSLVLVLVERLAATPPSEAALVRRYRLTRREAEIGALLASGLSTRQAAQALGITVNTSRRHVEHLLDKLGVHSRLAAVARLRGD